MHPALLHIEDLNEEQQERLEALIAEDVEDLESWRGVHFEAEYAVVLGGEPIGLAVWAGPLSSATAFVWIASSHRGRKLGSVAGDLLAEKMKDVGVSGVELPADVMIAGTHQRSARKIFERMSQRLRDVEPSRLESPDDMSTLGNVELHEAGPEGVGDGSASWSSTLRFWLLAVLVVGSLAGAMWYFAGEQTKRHPGKPATESQAQSSVARPAAGVEESPTDVPPASTEERAVGGESGSAASGRDRPQGETASKEGTPSPTRKVRDEGLRIPESGVGTNVVGHRLVGKADRFTTGTQVWFWTLVVGATPGDVVKHIWLFQGRNIATHELTIDGTHWRTYTSQTLSSGREGNWAVEARTADGELLAREEFLCRPRQD